MAKVGKVGQRGKVVKVGKVGQRGNVVKGYQKSSFIPTTLTTVKGTHVCCGASSFTLTLTYSRKIQFMEGRTIHTSAIFQSTGP